MGDSTISWLFRPGTRPRSWNPTQGCEMVSPGCKNCYAMRLAARFAKDGWSQGLIDLTTKKWSRVGRVAHHRLADPLSWREPSTVFVNSMSDLFWDAFSNEEVAAVFGIMAACQRHTFIIATKRAERLPRWFQWLDDTVEGPAAEWSGRECGVGVDDARAVERGLLVAENASRMLGSDEGSRGAWLMELGDRYAGDGPEVTWRIPWPLPNVWILVSVENQDMANERLPFLERIPAAVRGVSAEPLLGAVDFHRWIRWINWVIAGCESGPGARPAQTAWFRAIRNQCRAARVPFFFKQAKVTMEGIGGDTADLKPGRVAEPPRLDDVTHQEFPG